MIVIPRPAEQIPADLGDDFRFFLLGGFGTLFRYGQSFARLGDLEPVAIQLDEPLVHAIGDASFEIFDSRGARLIILKGECDAVRFVLAAPQEMIKAVRS